MHSRLPPSPSSLPRRFARPQQASLPWREFKIAAASKVGLQGCISNVQFFWEGCVIDEEGDQRIGAFAKDGDTFVLIPGAAAPLKTELQRPLDNAEDLQLQFQVQQQPASTAAPPVAVERQRTQRAASQELGRASSGEGAAAAQPALPWHGQVRRGASHEGESLR
jgi:hypothetical protein